MADRYLLESGPPDGYLLEDGSGVYLLEDVPFAFIARRAFTTPQQAGGATAWGSGVVFALSAALIAVATAGPPVGGDEYRFGTHAQAVYNASTRGSAVFSPIIPPPPADTPSPAQFIETLPQTDVQPNRSRAWGPQPPSAAAPQAIVRPVLTLPQSPPDVSRSAVYRQPPATDGFYAISTFAIGYAESGYYQPSSTWRAMPPSAAAATPRWTAALTAPQPDPTPNPSVVFGRSTAVLFPQVPVIRMAIATAAELPRQAPSWFNGGGAQVFVLDGITGSASISLDGLTLSATAEIPEAGQADITLGALTQVATAVVPDASLADITLASMTMASIGEVLVQGNASIQLGSLTLFATNVVPPATTGYRVYKRHPVRYFPNV